jgi:hypothetical protein
MNQIACATVVTLVLMTPVRGQEAPAEMPALERKPYSLNGFVELRPLAILVDTDAALTKLRTVDGDAPGRTATQLNSRVQLDAAYRRGWFGARTRAVVGGGYDRSDWRGDATAYEAYVSVNPGPFLTVDIGKRTFRWGKGYLWNPAAFIDRPKNPEDPALALEGFVALSADYIRTFTGPLQVVSVTPVVLPVFGGLNRDFGQRDHVNLAGRLYLLLYDTDLDVMFLTGGSRPDRFGFDASRNLSSNVEVHAEWTHIPNSLLSVLSGSGALVPRTQPATDFVLGLRYLTKQNTTYIIDYFRHGSGYARSEIDAYFELIERGYESSASGDGRLLAAARAAADTGYGRMTPQRNYVYGRVNQPDALGILYLTLGGSAIVNADDGSHSLMPEVQYRPTENLELRWLANIQRGASRTEFGEKMADLRLEVRVRYYF